MIVLTKKRIKKPSITDIDNAVKTKRGGCIFDENDPAWEIETILSANKKSLYFLDIVLVSSEHFGVSIPEMQKKYSSDVNAHRAFEVAAYLMHTDPTFHLSVKLILEIFNRKSPDAITRAIENVSFQLYKEGSKGKLSEDFKAIKKDLVKIV